MNRMVKTVYDRIAWYKCNENKITYLCLNSTAGNKHENWCSAWKTGETFLR